MSNTVQISFSAEKRTVTAPAGKCLLDVMRQEGIFIDALCGGNGTCGKCLVSIDGRGIQRACRYCADTDITVDTSLSRLAGGNSSDGGCEEKTGRKAETKYGAHRTPVSRASENAFREENTEETAEENTVRAAVKGSEKTAEETAEENTVRAAVKGSEKTAEENTEEAAGGQRFLAAVDVGTTTVVAYVLRASDGNTVAAASCTNPQAAYGADVVTRINEAITHGSGSLTACIRHAVDALVSEAAMRAGIRPDEIRALSIVGNTCMHHLFLGLPTESLAYAPYRPAVTQALAKEASQLGLHIHPDAEVYFPPNIAGFVGGDTVACMVSERPDLQSDWTLLLDIGTNGEIVLGCRERLLACSAAAGPAFEGAGISCGMRGSEGAISHARWSGDKWELETIGGKAPVGICGSGLLDIAASLLKSGQMDETGLLTGGGPVTVSETLQTEEASENKINGGTGRRIEVTQKDIRALQLAKAAICAGIRLLCREAQIRPEEIRRVLLAGAFGSFLSPDSACSIGLIPKELRGRIHVIGNAAGEGAKMLVLNVAERACAEALAAKTEYLELAAIPQFQDVFVDELGFPEP